MSADRASSEEIITAGHEAVARLRREVARAIVGQEEVIDRLIVALLIRGHVLVE